MDVCYPTFAVLVIFHKEHKLAPRSGVIAIILAFSVTSCASNPNYPANWGVPKRSSTSECVDISGTYSEVGYGEAHGTCEIIAGALGPYCYSLSSVWISLNKAVFI